MAADPMKPLLLLDVDGALSPLPRGDERRYPSGVEWVEVTHVFSEVVVDARLPGWLAQLAELYELAWATTWEEMANERLAGPLGLPQLPVIAFLAMTTAQRSDAEKHGHSYKFPAVVEFVGDRQAAWIDDHITAADLRFANAHRRRWLFLRTTKNRGITPRHVEQLVAWATELRDASPAAAQTP